MIFNVQNVPLLPKNVLNAKVNYSLKQIVAKQHASKVFMQIRKITNVLNVMITVKSVWFLLTSALLVRIKPIYTKIFANKLAFLVILRIM